MNLALRPPAHADRAAWDRLWQGYQRFYKVEIAQEVSDQTWARLHDPAEPIWACLAWQGARAVGMVHWIYHRSTWTDGPYCYLQDLYVDEDVRGSGAGGEALTKTPPRPRGRSPIHSELATRSASR